MSGHAYERRRVRCASPSTETWFLSTSCPRSFTGLANCRMFLVKPLQRRRDVRRTVRITVLHSSKATSFTLSTRHESNAMMIKMRVALLTLASATLVTAGQNEASAADITNFIRQPVQMVSPLIPFVDVSTAVPTTNEILAVPAPGRNNLTAYPASVINYGLTVSPSARVLRQNGLMFFNF